MFWKPFQLVLPAALLVAGTACGKKITATDVHMERMTETRNKPRARFIYMADNAAVLDMSVADFHFVGHTSELSGTGVARLDRLAHFLDVYGGTVRYETYLTDEGTVEQRLAHVREYLALAGCNMERVEVAAVISGGRGMPATQAIEIDEQAAAPEGDGGVGVPLGAPAGS